MKLDDDLQVEVFGNQREDGEMSLGEKRMCRQLLGKQPKLPYPLKAVMCADGVTQQEYEIPEEDREKVLHQLCFLLPAPKLDDDMFDLHEQKLFKVREYRVIRWRDTNILASPYYPHSGGMLVDWIPPEQQFDDTQVVKLNPSRIRR